MHGRMLCSLSVSSADAVIVITEFVPRFFQYFFNIIAKIFKIQIMQITFVEITSEMLADFF